MARWATLKHVASVVTASLLTATSLSAQTIQLENLDGVPFDNRLVFSRIGSLSDPPPNGVHERVTLRIKNAGQAQLLITGLTIGGSDQASFATDDPPALPATVDPESFLDIRVRFTAESARRVHSATLTITSNDPANSNVFVELSGYWQQVSEGNREPAISQIINVLGYETTIVTGDQALNQQGRIESAGDEVLSPYWRRADFSEPVTVRQLAAFHTYPEANGLFWHYQGSTAATLIFRHNAQDAQSMLPRIHDSSLPAEGTFSPSSSTAGGVFGLRVQQNEWSDPDLNDKSKDDCSGGMDTCGHHVRFWPAKDRQGEIIPNTFIMAMDFAGINYDYNDNVYLISNITPENPVAGLQTVRINAGGEALVTGGLSYLATIYADGGESWTPKCDLGDIAGTTDDDLYRTEWSEAQSFSFRIPAIAGTYLVRLHFAEIAHGNCSGSEGGPGKRVFDVLLEGTRVLKDFDISAEVGAVTALIKSFHVDIEDGLLDIAFAASVDFPMVSAIEVLPTANEAPVASFTASPQLGDSPPLQVAFDASASFDPDGSIASYHWEFGDGATGGGVTTTHSYSAIGTYTATLTVTDDEGASTTATETITVTDSEPIASFTEISWSVVQPQPFVNPEGQSTVVGGKLYSFGGFDSQKGCCTPTKRSYVYDADTNTWTVIADLPFTNGGGATHHGVTTDGTNIFLAGGYIANAAGTAQIFGTREVWRYNVGSDTYTRLPDLPVERAAGRLEYLDGKLHYFGGTNIQRTQDVGDHYVLHLANLGGGWTAAAPLPNPRHHMGSVVLGGSIYAIGGQHDHDHMLVTQASVHAYNPANDAWTAVANLPFARSHHATVVHGGRIISLGGETKHGTVINDVDAYNPQSNTWVALTNLPVNRRSGVAGNIDGILYYSGGNNASQTYKGEAEESDSSRPSVTGTSPVDGATGVPRDAFVAVDVALPNVGEGIDPATLTVDNVMLYPSGNPAAVVPANLNTSGGGDAIVLQPTTLLAANTPYIFKVTDGLKDLSGASFTPMQSSFKTGSTPSGGSTSSIKFEKVPLPNAQGKHTTVTIGPDGKLYATRHDGLIKRWSIASDGALVNLETMNALRVAEDGNRLLVGLTFDPASTADNLIAWVSHTTYGFQGMEDWGGKITKMSGPNLETVQDYLVNLPRSIRDHVTNSLAFGPDGALYVNQGSNSSMGAPDNAWGNRPERMLNAAVLRVDISGLDALPTLPLDVRTDNGTYDPLAADAPVKIFASGVRNAYDLVWHSNGFLYLPTNGSAANGKTPVSVVGTKRPSGQLYGGPDVPAIDSVETQNDYLFRVPPPSEGTWSYNYYGHPNPGRGEYVLNGGNPTIRGDMAEVERYPVGVEPDEAWAGHVFNFGRNISPNGIIEYRSDAFDGMLQSKLLVVRYSGGDDIIVLTPDPSSGDILPDGDETGIVGLTQFSDPLDLTENTSNGHLYVSEYGGAGAITLLRPASAAGATDTAFVEADGRVVIEAENFDDNVGRGGKSWEPTELTGNVGGSMQAGPVTFTTIDTGYASNSPELRFRVQFDEAGTYYVWTRVQGADGDSDSWHVGLDGQEIASADRMTIGSGFNQWRWINKTMDPERATLEIASPAIYIVNVWMREDGVHLDRLLLTTDPDFEPSGEGPSESPRTVLVGTATEPDESIAGETPGQFELQGNYPNPFNPVTTIQYALPELVHVKLDVFDVLGRHVARLVDDTQLPGIHRALFDAGDLASGVYLYRLDAGAFTQTLQMILLK